MLGRQLDGLGGRRPLDTARIVDTEARMDAETSRLVRDWDVHWRWQRFLKPSPGPHQTGRRSLYKAFVAALAPRPGAVVLDASSGLGDSLLLLHQAGFDADACDASPEAVDATREAAVTAGLAAHVFCTTWEDIGRTAPRRYEAILNDALSWIPDDAQYLAALVGLRTVLLSGGRLYFVGAKDRHSEPGYGLSLLEEKWARMGHERIVLGRSRSSSSRSVVQLVVRERGETWIDEHQVYVILENGVPRVETARLRQPFHRDWPAVSSLIRAAGFAELRCEEVRVEGKVVVVNVARAP
jgi:hypothetical protein